MRHTLWLAALVLGATACEDISSNDLLTSGINAHIAGTARGAGQTEVVAVLKAGGGLSNTFVDLEGDDQLTVSVADKTGTLSKRSLGVLHDYVATVDHDVAGDTFTVAFERTIDDGAPSSTFVLPEPFTLEDAADAFDPDTDLSLTWTPTGDGEMEVFVDGSCIHPWADKLTGDPGSAVVPGSEIETLDGEPGASCGLDIIVRRTLGGQLDPGFGEGGVAQGRQDRSTSTTWSSGT